MRIALLSASLRKASFNTQLMGVAKAVAEKASHTCKAFTLNDLPLPTFNEDDESATGVPTKIAEFCALLRASDAVVICTPEYNGSIASPLKTFLDWTSRVDQVPWAGRHILLMSASPGALGGVRGLWHTRVPLEALGAHVYPEMFGLPKAHEAFSEGVPTTLPPTLPPTLKDEKTLKRMSGLLESFLTFAESKNA